MPGEIIQRKLRRISPEQLSSLEGLLLNKTSVRSIASRWKVTNKTVYYWIYKSQIPLKEIKHQVPNFNTAKQPTYFYYVNKAYKQGKMNKKERARALNQFYQNRKRVYNNGSVNFLLVPFKR